MKARKIRKIRAKAKMFTVMTTVGLFGDFRLKWFDKHGEQVLAFTPVHAVRRAKKRRIGLEHTYNEHGRRPNWARWVVKLAHKNNHWRNLHYF